MSEERSARVRSSDALVDPEIERRVRRRIEGYRAAMVAFQTALTAIPAIGPDNGGEGEARRGAFLEEQARTLGFEHIERYDAPDARVPSRSRPNLLVRVPGRQPRPRVLVLAHVDTVPPGERRLWHSDPFEVVERDGRLYGRGVEDDQQGLTVGLFALKALLDEGLLPSTEVILALVADEETGNEYGVEHLLSSVPDLVDADDLVVVPDYGTPLGDVIEVAEKTTLWLELVVLGKQVHASMPQEGVNAHRAAAHLVVRLDAALHARFAGDDPLFDPPVSTFEPTKRLANVPNVNTIPGEERLFFDCRLLPDVVLQEVKEVARRIAGEVESEFGVVVEVGYPAELPAAPPTRSDAPVVRALATALRQARGVEATACGIGGGTVAAVFRRRGIPAVAWSTNDDMAHQPDEYCLIDNLVADAMVLALLCVRGTVATVAPTPAV